MLLQNTAAKTAIAMMQWNWGILLQYKLKLLNSIANDCKVLPCIAKYYSVLCRSGFYWSVDCEGGGDSCHYTRLHIACYWSWSSLGWWWWIYCYRSIWSSWWWWWWGCLDERLTLSGHGYLSEEKAPRPSTLVFMMMIVIVPLIKMVIMTMMRMPLYV